jgi:hypothetical protein
VSAWVRRGAASGAAAAGGVVGAVLTTMLVLTAPARAAPPADSTAETAGHVIGRIEILRRNVFDPRPGSRLGGVEGLANRLHVRTRPGTIRSQLLFEPGERWDEARARETARNLRGLDYLDPIRVEARLEGDSAVAVVETRDLWTMTPRFDIASADGRHVGSFGLTDRNFFGYGKSVELAYRDDENGISRHIGYDDPGLGGGRHRLHYAAGKGVEGASDEIALGLPFYAERVLRAYSAGWSRATFVTHLFSDGAERASFNERSERAEVWYGGRRRDEETIQRLIGSFELWDRRLGPTRLSAGAPPGFGGREENIRIRRMAGELVWRRPNFVEHRNINRFTRTEDFDCSPQLSLKLGFAPRAFGSSQDEGYWRVHGNLGADTRFGFGWVSASGSSRLAPEATERILQLDARWYTLVRPPHLIALGVSGIAGANTPRDFQALAGGLNGLRAYPIDAVAGQQLWRLNAEERWRFSPAAWEFVNLGSALFFDAARAWGTGGANTGWFRDAGVGLRVGIPSWGVSEVLRVDVAWPIEPTRNGGNQPVLTFGSSQAF